MEIEKVGEGRNKFIHAINSFEYLLCGSSQDIWKEAALKERKAHAYKKNKTQ